MRQQMFMQLMRVLPKSALSTVVGAATRAPLPPLLHQTAMRIFAKSYSVNLDEAEGSIGDYPTFAQFFTRRLKPEARSIDRDPNVIISPVDGCVSQAGAIESGQCLQAKGISFPVEKLLADGKRAAAFNGGQFVTLYLSPRDYHRFHAPIAGKVTAYQYIPGEFWPVNAASVALKDALFAVNERLVTYLETEVGTIAYVAVGATCVARIHATYESIVTHLGEHAHGRVLARPVEVEKGGEIGMFEMGSTIIMLFEPGRVRFEPQLKPEAQVRLGQRIGIRV